jgi:hypothetical protein
MATDQLRSKYLVIGYLAIGRSVRRRYRRRQAHRQGLPQGRVRQHAFGRAVRGILSNRKGARQLGGVRFGHLRCGSRLRGVPHVRVGDLVVNR